MKVHVAKTILFKKYFRKYQEPLLSLCIFNYLSFRILHSFKNNLFRNSSLRRCGFRTKFFLFSEIMNCDRLLHGLLVSIFAGVNEKKILEKRNSLVDKKSTSTTPGWFYFHFQHNFLFYTILIFVACFCRLLILFFIIFSSYILCRSVE